MKQEIPKNLSRRAFLSLGSGFLLAGSVFGWADSEKEIGPAGKLPEQLSDDEKKRISSSSMAQEILDHFGQGYSCAESLLLTALNHMEKPEELVWAGSGFGGGMYHKNLCGFLTAGIMAIGLSAGALDMDRKQAKSICSKNVKEYWKWWQSAAPLKCSEIRPEGTSSKVCRRLGQLAAAKVESLISSGEEGGTTYLHQEV